MRRKEKNLFHDEHQNEMQGFLIPFFSCRAMDRGWSRFFCSITFIVVVVFIYYVTIRYCFHEQLDFTFYIYIIQYCSMKML